MLVCMEGLQFHTVQFQCLYISMSRLILHSLKLCEYSARKVGDCFVKEVC